MRYRIPAVFATSLLAIPIVYAQFTGFGEIGGLLSTIFGGIFGALQTNPNIWFRVVVGIIFLILFNIGLSQVGIFASNKNGRIMLSVVLGIAMAAAIPPAIIESLFNSIGVLVTFVYVIPLIWLIFFSAKQEEHSKTKYIGIAILWAFLTWFYFSGVVNAGFAFVSTIILLLGIASLIAMIVYIFKAWNGPSLGTREGDANESLRRESQDLAEAIKAAEDAQRAAAESNVAAAALKQQLEQSEINAQNMQRDLQTIDLNISELLKQLEIREVEAERKLKEARDIQNTAASDAEKLKKAQEAAAEQQRLAAFQEAARQKAQQAMAELDAELKNVDTGLTGIINILNLITDIKSKISRIKNLEEKVKKAITEIENLKRRINALTDIHQMERDINALGSADLMNKFLTLKKELESLQGELIKLDQRKLILEQHLAYFTQSRTQMDNLLNKLLARRAQINKFRDNYQNIVTLLKSKGSPLEIVKRALNFVNKNLAEQQAWHAGIKKELLSLQEMGTYQGNAAKVIIQDINNTFAEISQIKDSFLDKLDINLKTLQSSINVAKKEKQTIEKLNQRP